MTLDKFIIQFPEFKKTDLNQVQAMLDAAALEIDTSVWKSKSDQGQAYLAAHKLAISPFGGGTRLQVKGDGTSTYWTHYVKIRAQVASGFRVA